MKRKAFMRDGDKFEVLEESEFEAETALQEALKRNPEVIPVADLDLSNLVVVGRETGVAPGAIDLLLVDGDGRVIILETKLARNPELRRQAVAQLLDYGAGLWQTAPGLKEFEELVLGYWRSDQCEDQRVKHAGALREGLEGIFKELCGDDWDYELFEARLDQNLAAGHHVLIVVATGLMDSISRRLLEYANTCLGLPLYGVAIDVFKADTRELIIPRGVRYTPQSHPRKAPTRAWDPNTFFAGCTEVAASFFRRIHDEAEGRGMIIPKDRTGLTVRLPLEKPVTVMLGQHSDQFLVNTRPWSDDEEGRARIRERLRAIAPFSTKDEYTDVLQVAEQTLNQAHEALEFIWEEVDKLTAGDRDSGRRAG